MYGIILVMTVGTVHQMAATQPCADLGDQQLTEPGAELRLTIRANKSALIAGAVRNRRSEFPSAQRGVDQY